MRHLKHLVITFPMAAVTLTMLSARPSLSAAIDSVRALSMLAEARIADGRCGYLDASDHQELSDYLARAEVASAQRSGVAVTRMAIAAGRAKGDTAPCDPATRSTIESTLRAAREAMAATELRSSLPEEPPPASEPLRTSSIAPAAPPAQPRRTAAAANADRTGGYERAAMAYYLDRRCRHLSRRDANSFWKAIVARHQAALSAYGSKAVKSALSAAEAAASSRSCGSATAELVKENFAALSR
jgi:hypothetical protein